MKKIYTILILLCVCFYNLLAQTNVVYQAVVDPTSRSLNTSYKVGATKGAFNVNTLGAGTYSIPLEVPPGIAGLQPNLSLTYNSLSGPGNSGYGWNLSGISVITRNAQAYCYDNNAEGITLTDEDRFALDGQRLVKISGTSYGANGSVYRTENDNFSKVTCYTGSYGADKFEVKTKTGLTCQYGYTSNSDQTVSGETKTLNWFVNKIKDVYNNEINYTYINDNGINYISQISYGPNTISFSYKQRTDKTTSYFVGNTLQQSLLLEKVEMKYNSTLVKKYELKYNDQADNYDSHSVLNEVIEYGINGSRFNSTVFSYEYPSGTCSNYPYMSYNSYISTEYTQYPGDFNGDGRMDIFTIRNSDRKYWRLYLATESGGFSYSTSGQTLRSVDHLCVCDINADGMDDLIYIDLDGSTLFYTWSVSNGTSFETAHVFASHGVDPNQYESFYDFSINYSKNISQMTYDYDGNGLNDFMIIDRQNNIWRMFSFTPASINSDFTDNNRTGSVSSWGDFFRVGDFNGDGKADIWTFDSNGVKVYSYNNSDLEVIYSGSYPNKNHLFKLGDFNGDGKTDIFVYGSGSYEWASWQFRLSTGTGFVANYFTKKKTDLKSDVVYTGDFNGDGKTDILALSENTSGNPRQYYFVTNRNATNVNSEYYERSEYDKDRNFTFGDFDGNGKTDILVTTASNKYYRGKLSGNTKVLLSRIADGLNNTTGITYRKLSEQYSSYTKGTSSTSFPVYTYMGPLEVVSEYWVNGGSTASPDYFYTGLKIHRQGKGVLGYEKVIVEDSQLDTELESSYGYHSSKFFPELLSAIKKQGDVTISTVNNSWDYKTTTGSAIFPYISSSTQTNNLTGQDITTSFEYDTYGNPTEIKKVYDNGVTATTTNQYTNDASNWLIGKLNTSEVKHEKSGETTITNTVSYTYYTDGILKPDFIRYFQNTDKYYYKNHDYDGNGNLTQLYEYASGVGSRSTNYTYEINGIRVKTISDPMGHVSEMFYDDDYGRLTSEKDYLNNTTVYTYDNMNRQLTETGADGFISTTSYNWGLSGGPTNACYYVQQSGNDGSLGKVWYDKLGRELRNDVKGFNGSDIYALTKYNTKGQLYQVSEPSTSTSPSQWNTYSYYTNGRINGITRPSGRNTTYTYEAGTSKITETTGGKSSWKETDSQGLLTKAHDNGGDIVYSYRPDGKLKSVTPAGGSVTTMDYDVAGNQTKLDDPSAGTIFYTYNAFGQLKTQKNGRNQITTNNYYADGRIHTIVSPEGTTTYYYNSKEQLTSITSPESVSRGYGYYPNGLTQTITETIPGSSTFSTTFTYDKGRLKTKTHPSGIVETLNYNSNGYLASISAGGATRYTISSMNARQQITATTFGSGVYGTYGFDNYGYPTSSYVESYSSIYGSNLTMQDYIYSFNSATGNLYSRRDKNSSVGAETFTYDNLDRLLTVGGSQNLTMAYEDNGNITTKSDVGTNTFGYNNSSNPFALTDLETSSGLIPEDEQTIGYNSFEQPTGIEEGDYYATFKYNCDGQRCKMEVDENSDLILTRWYAGSSYIKETKGSTTLEITWIGGDAYSAPAVAINDGTTTTWDYLLRDYLGNITGIVTLDEDIAFEYSYDSWGRRRNHDDWSYSLSSEPNLLADRGFTGHEYLPWFNLYNMNGRLYDPIVGRFLSPDENVQMPGFTQNYNRYSYCLNNPLAYTDPDGENPVAIIIGAIIGAYTGSATANGTFNPSKWDYSSGKTWGYMLGGAVVGAASGGLAGSIATSGMPMANTAAIMSGSFVNSVGMNIVTGGQTDVSIGFGVASYNMSRGEWGYLGKKRNSFIENLGYGLGSVANIGDVLAGFNTSEVQLNTENSDAIGHSALTKVGETNSKTSYVSVGPDPGGKWIFNPFKFKNGTNHWKNYVNAGDDVAKVTVKGINLNRIVNYGARLDKGVNYNLYVSSCVNHTARALTLAGAPALGIHPFLLHAQMYMRSIGARPSLFSYYTYNH